jgi:hypothetical protein
MSLENHTTRIQNALFPIIPPQGSKKSPNHKIQLIKALYALNNKDFLSISAAAKFFKVYPKTLRRRRNGGLTQSTSHEIR